MWSSLHEVVKDLNGRVIGRDAGLSITGMGCLWEVKQFFFTDVTHLVTDLT